MDRAMLRTVPRMFPKTTSKLTVFQKRPAFPSPSGQPLVQVRKQLPRMRWTLAGSQMPICQLASGGLERSRALAVLLCAACTRSVSGSQGVSTPLGRDREGKLSRLSFCMPSSCGDSRREWPRAKNGGTWLPNWKSPPTVHSGGSKAGAESLFLFGSACKCLVFRDCTWLGLLEPI